MKKKYIWLTAAIIWCVAIFIATASPQATGNNTEMLLAKWLHLTKEQAQWFNFMFRKSVHLVSFGLLAFLFYFSFENRQIILAWGLTTIYASTDEFHQLFVPGRTGAVTDVIIDSIGAVIGILLAIIFQKIMKCNRSSSSSN